MPGSHPAVSVLLCIHNGERFLAATLESLLAQSYSDFEVVAVDDGSTDNSARIVERFRDPRIRLIRQDCQGPANATDTALRAALGEYVAFLDHDDLWTHDKLAIHVETHARHPEVDLTFSWFRVINDEDGEIGLRSNRHRGTIGFPGLLANFVIGAISNVVVRKSALEQAGGIDRTLPHLYDLDLCLRIALLTPHNMLAIERDLMLYRRHYTQISRDIPSLEREWEQVLLKFEALAPNEFRPVAGLARSNMDRYFASLAYEGHQYRRALSYLAQGWRDSPGRFLIEPRNWMTMAACASGLLLPSAIHQRLERVAGLNRNAVKKA